MTLMHTTTVRAGEGVFTLEASVTVTPRGITVTACSPDYAHVGATAQAIPRPEPGRTATVSILAVPCHRDEIPAHDIAAALATRFGIPAVATCGFHVDNASGEDIERFMNTTRELIESIAAYVERVCRSAWTADEDVVTVSNDGVVAGSVSRARAHEGEGILHQAFSIYLIEGSGPDARVLLCRRNPMKRLWGGVLADTCAGHPFVGEDLAAAASRRLSEETGVLADEVELSQVGHVVYREDHGDGHCECEWCGVFAARLPEHVRLSINEEEISEIRRVSLDEVDGYLAGRPEPLAPWSALALRDEGIRKALSTFANAD